MSSSGFPKSFRIGSIWGIPIDVHYSFLLILPFLAWSFGKNIESLSVAAMVSADELILPPTLFGILAVITLFGSVILHELAHSLVALRKGIRIRGITMMLFGGVARLEEMPTKPGEEAKIALAGPGLSIGLGVGAFIVRGYEMISSLPDLSLLLFLVFYLNTLLGLFNLLPAFPMDGGRILRSLLARKRSFISATKTAVNVGKFFAFLFGAAGVLTGNFVLVFIAFFVYIGASQEEQFSVIRATLDGFRVRDLMSSPVHTVGADTMVLELKERMAREHHNGYPVVFGDRAMGCVTSKDVEQVKPDEIQTAKVRDIMTREVQAIRPDDDIYLALKAMSERDIGRLLVVDDEDRLVGIITRSDLMRGFHLRKGAPD